MQILTAVLILLVAGIASAGQGVWRDATPAQARAKSLVGDIHNYSADQVALRNLLSLVPHIAHGDFSRQIDLPMPDGSLASFTIVESPIMKPALAARYPDIKTFKVYGIDDPMASGRVDITPQGFHAMLFTANGRLFIDPDHTSTQPDQYLSRYRSGQPSQKLSCGIHKPDFEDAAGEMVAARFAARIPGRLIEYDLAVAATEEYVFALGGTVAMAQAGIVTAINQVNLIYERDLGIRLMLVGNNDQLIESGGNVNFDNSNATVILEQNQTWIDSQSTNLGFDYDIGHVFGTGVGGAAFLGAACNSSIKAKGTSGQSVPLGNTFYIDYVAHEIGHQFNAEHSFNGTTSSCGNGRVQASAFEPGSGSSIMAYAGICLSENLQMNSDSTFHAASIAQIDSFTKGAGSCYAIPTTPTNNNDPTITPLSNRVVPANTPFILDSIAIDNDPMPTLSYQWDQMDAGCPTNSTSFGTDNGSNALFRSYVPRGESWRNFPALGTQVQGRFDKAEVLPCQNRNLDFRLTARDGNSGQDTEDLRVSVTNAAGPFAITNLTAAQTLTSGSAFTVSWNIANTNLPPINCANVDIDLLTFSDTSAPMPMGQPRTYSIHPLATMVPNINGSASVTINPIDSAHPQARIRVKCNGNIFYDISDADLIVTEAFGQTPNRLGDTDDEFYFPGNMFITDAVAPACGAVVDCGLLPVESKKSSDRGSGSGAFDFFWLLMMTGMIAVVKLLRRYSLQ
jgi:hypothetical protein